MPEDTIGEVNCECPTCRGTGIRKDWFAYDGPPENATAPADGKHSTVLLATAEELKEWGSSWSLLSIDEYLRQKRENAWWQDQQNNSAYERQQNEPQETNASVSRDQIDMTWTHLKKTTSKTKLLDGRLSMLVDLGSRINIIGENTEKEFSLEAERNGYAATYDKRKHRLNVNGVGSGSAPCDEEARLPIAVKFEDKAATIDEFKANIAQGSGCDLPAILGSQSMQDKDAVILLRKGKEMIVFPGPGGYKIEWSPGSQLLPMVSAPSGHLVIPCDRYAEVDRNKTNADQAITFWTDHAVASSSSRKLDSNTAAEWLNLQKAEVASSSSSSRQKDPAVERHDSRKAE